MALNRVSTMKNEWMGILTCVIMALQSHGQDTFQLRNYDSTVGLHAPIYDWAGSPLSGPEWRVETYGGPTVESMTPLVVFDNAKERIIMSLGRLGYFENRISGTPTVVSVEPGGWAWLQVKVWSINLGATYEAVSSRGLGGYGESTPFYAKGGNPYALELPQPLLGLQSFSVLQPVPEPSTYALLLTGIGSLCWLCRRGS